jgi:hypothetical protein
MREEHRLRFFKNRVPRDIFGPTRGKVRGIVRNCTVSGFVSLHHAKYYSGDQIKNNEMGRACGRYRGEERCIQGFGGETSGKATTWKALAYIR